MTSTNSTPTVAPPVPTSEKTARSRCERSAAGSARPWLGASSRSAGSGRTRRKAREGSTRIVVPFLLAALGCSAPPPPHGVIRVLLDRDPETLDPRFCTDPLCVRLTRLLYAS